MEPELAEAYKKLYSENEGKESEETVYVLPAELKNYGERIIRDFVSGYYEANRRIKKRLGIGAHLPRRVVVTDFPLIEYNANGKTEIGVIKGAYDSEEDAVYINSAFYALSCYPLLVNIEDGSWRILPVCYRLNENPSKTCMHETFHATFNDLAFNRYKQEIAVRKLGG